MNHNIYKKASDIVNNVKEACFSYIDGNGYPHGATRTKMKSEGMMACWFSTNTSGDLSQAIRKDGRASVCFLHDNDNITLIGDAKIVNDPKIKEALWIDWFINHYPGGPSDPEYTVIEFRTKQASLWIDKEVIKFDISLITDITSRCGLLCQTCDWRDSHNCGTCIKTDGHPFYGECPIAVCCQDKGYLHCGQCPDMPCEQLHAYSCGEGEHCDSPKGARLDILKMWDTLL